MKSRLRQIVKKIAHLSNSSVDPLDIYKKNSWSQSGEDLIIEYLFRLRKIEAPFCLDIGAYHPVVSNNTYKFFLKGSKVINIDANPAAIRKFMEIRPSDINLNIGIGAKMGLFDFYIMEEESLNTFSEGEMIKLEKLGHKLKEVQKLKMIPINSLLEQYCSNISLDFVSIDAEGTDFDIIKSYDFENYAPKVICIETINYTPDGTGTKRIDLCRMIEAKGYFEYANTNINSIFVKKVWWFGSHEGIFGN